MDYELNLCVDCQSCIGLNNFGGGSAAKSQVNEVIFPNPFINEINLSYYSNESQNIQFRILNIDNQESVVINDFVDKGSNQKRIDTSMLKPGVYIVTINNGIESWSKKIVKLGIGNSRH